MGSTGCLSRSSLSLNYISGCFLAMETKAHIVSEVVFVANNEIPIREMPELDLAFAIAE